MLEARDLYEAELARCRATLDAVGWLSATVAETHLRCTECGSDLVEQRDPSNSDQATMDLFCQGCGAALDVEWRPKSLRRWTERFQARRMIALRTPGRAVPSSTALSAPTRPISTRKMPARTAVRI